MSERQTNIALSLTMAGLGVLGLGYLVPVHVGSITSSAALLPVLGFSALVVLGLALFAATLREPESAAEAEPGEEDDRGDPVPLLPIVAVLAVYAGLLGQLGFLTASAAALFVLLLLYRIRRPVRLLLVTAGTIAVIHIGIERLLGTPLPSGDLLKIIPF